MTLPKELEDIIYQYHHNLLMTDILKELCDLTLSKTEARGEFLICEINKMSADPEYRTPITLRPLSLFDNLTPEECIIRAEHEIRRCDYITSQGYICISG